VLNRDKQVMSIWLEPVCLEEAVYKGIALGGPRGGGPSEDMDTLRALVAWSVETSSQLKHPLKLIKTLAISTIQR